MTDKNHIWVIDTSSIIHVKRAIPNLKRKHVWNELDKLVESGSLVYPAEVVIELSDYEEDDAILAWGKRNQTRACRHGSMFNQVSELLKNTQIRRILDPEKDGKEEADPYVLALALFLKSEYEVTVITEEKRDLPTKLSLSSACGLKRVSCVPLLPFLEQCSIYIAEVS